MLTFSPRRAAGRRIMTFVWNVLELGHHSWRNLLLITGNFDADARVCVQIYTD